MKKGKLREKFAILCSTASAIRLEKVSNHQFKTKKKEKNDSTDSIQKHEHQYHENKNSSKYTPKPWRVLRVSDEHSRPKPLRLD